MVSLIDNLRLALRDLRHRPGFAAIVALTLTVGIGATTAAFAPVDAVCLTRLPVKDQDRLVSMWAYDKAGGSPTFMPWDVQGQLRDRHGAFAGVATYWINVDPYAARDGNHTFHLMRVPAPGSPPDCTCKDLPDLVKDLDNATVLRNRFLTEAQTLNTDYPPPVNEKGRMESIAAEQTFTLHTAPDGIEAPPGYTGPSSVDYTPRNIDPDNLSKYTNAEQCEPGPGSRQDLSKAEAGSVCRAMAEAIRAHEKYHQDQCAAVGSKAYFHKSGVEKATEEAAAYQAQIAVLQAAIDKVRANLMKCFGVGHDTHRSLQLP